MSTRRRSATYSSTTAVRIARELAFRGFRRVTPRARHTWRSDAAGSAALVQRLRRRTAEPRSPLEDLEVHDERAILRSSVVIGSSLSASSSFGREHEAVFPLLNLGDAEPVAARRLLDRVSPRRIARTRAARPFAAQRWMSSGSSPSAPLMPFGSSVSGFSRAAETAGVAPLARPSPPYRRRPHPSAAIIS